MPLWIQDFVAGYRDERTGYHYHYVNGTTRWYWLGWKLSARLGLAR